jgi:hypothetical protein
MDEEKRAQTQKVVDSFNEAFKHQPAALRALLFNRVPCWFPPEDKSTLVLDSIDPDGTQWLGALGLVNGVLEALGLPRMAARWSPVPGDCKGKYSMTGFQVYEPAVTSEEGDQACCQLC